MRVVKRLSPESVILWSPSDQLRKRIKEEFNQRTLLCKIVYVNDQFAYTLFYLEQGGDKHLSIPKQISTDDYVYEGSAKYGECNIGVYSTPDEPDFAEPINTRNGIWVSGAEIVNSQQAFGTPIDKDVVKLFEAYPSLYGIYHRLPQNSHKLDVPSATYFGNSKERVALTLVMGLQRAGAAASEGPYYYTGSYERALRYACITSNKKPLKVDGYEVTYAGSAVYKKGALIRVFVLLGKTAIVSKFKEKLSTGNLAKDIISPDGSWAKDYDSIIQTRIFNGERRISAQCVVPSIEQINLGGYVYVDTSSVTSIDDYKKKAVLK